MRKLLEHFEKILLAALLVMFTVSVVLMYLAKETAAESNAILQAQNARVEEINQKQIAILERLARAEAKLDAVLLLRGKEKQQ